MKQSGMIDILTVTKIHPNCHYDTKNHSLNIVAANYYQSRSQHVYHDKRPQEV